MRLQTLPFFPPPFPHTKNKSVQLVIASMAVEAATVAAMDDATTPEAEVEGDKAEGNKAEDKAVEAADEIESMLQAFEKDVEKEAAAAAKTSSSRFPAVPWFGNCPLRQRNCLSLIPSWCKTPRANRRW